MTSFLVPLSLTWDKITALYVYIMYHLHGGDILDLKQLIASGKVRVVFEDESDIPTDAVDVDVQRKYTNTRHGSATEKACEDCVLDSVPGIDYLISILNQNNKTGCLKDERDSFVALIRQRFQGVHTVGGRLRVLYQFWPVVDAYFQVCETSESLISTWKNPFTMSAYLRILTLLQLPEKEIQERCKALEEVIKDENGRQDRAAEKAALIEGESFDLSVRGAPGNSVRGYHIRTDDSRLATQFWKAHPDCVLLIIEKFRSQRGRYCIQVRGQQDLAQLYLVLNTLEPGKWYIFEREAPQSPMLLNGSDSRAAEPSTMPPSRLTNLIQENLLYRPRRLQ